MMPHPLPFSKNLWKRVKIDFNDCLTMDSRFILFKRPLNMFPFLIHEISLFGETTERIKKEVF